MAKGKLELKSISMIVLVAIIGLMAFGAMFVKDADTDKYKFDLQQEPGELALNILKVVLITVFVFGAAALVFKMTGGSLGRKDYWKLIMIGAILWFAWEPVIKPILEPILGGAYTNIEEITIKLGQKMGVFK